MTSGSGSKRQLKNCFKENPELIYQSVHNYRRYLQGKECPTESPLSVNQMSNMLFRYSLGNLGSISTDCFVNNYTHSHNMNIQCNSKGHNSIQRIVRFGQVNTSLTDQACLPGNKGLDFFYSPNDCNQDLQTFTRLEEHFDKFCVGKNKCELDLHDVFINERRQDVRPVQCSQQSERNKIDLNDFAYMIEVECHPPMITIPELNYLEVPNDILTLVLVGSDLFIIIFFYLTLVCLTNFQKKVVNDIGEAVLTADDFTVCIRGLPNKRVENSNQLKELKSMIWSWTEDVLMKEKPLKNGPQFYDPMTQHKDLNQNNLMNIIFGMDRYWKMDLYMDIAKDFKQKKMLFK